MAFRFPQVHFKNAPRRLVGYLSLDAAEASEPEDLAVAELPLCVVDLVHVLQLLKLLVRDLLLLRAVACCFQEFQAAGGYGGDHLRDGGRIRHDDTNVWPDSRYRANLKLASMTEEKPFDVVEV